LRSSFGALTIESVDGISWATVLKLGQLVALQKTIDLKNGLSLAQLRREIETFGSNLAKIKLDQDFFHLSGHG
jgi:hypothetical protein